MYAYFFVYDFLQYPAYISHFDRFGIIVFPILVFQFLEVFSHASNEHG